MFHYFVSEIKHFLGEMEIETNPYYVASEISDEVK